MILNDTPVVTIGSAPPVTVAKGQSITITVNHQ